MAQLIKTYLPKASTRDGGPLIAKATGSNPIKALGQGAAAQARRADPRHQARGRRSRRRHGRGSAGQAQDPGSRPDPRSRRPSSMKTHRLKAPVRSRPISAEERDRSGQHGVGAVRLGRAGRLVAEQDRSAGLPRQDGQARRPRCLRPPPASPFAYEQGRRHLLTAPALAASARRMPRGRPAPPEEEENRVLRRPAIGGEETDLPEMLFVEGD